MPPPSGLEPGMGGGQQIFPKVEVMTEHLEVVDMSSAVYTLTFP